MSLAPRSRVTTLVTLVAALVVGLTAVATGVSRSADVAAKVSAAVSAEAACPPGTQPLGNERETPIDQTGAAARYRGGLGASPNELSYGLYSDCAPIDRPESFQELALRDAQQSGIRSAPFDDVPGEALLAAVDQRAGLVGRSVANSGGSMTKYGTGPLNFDDPRFGEVNGQGIVDSTGRVDGFHHDPGTNRLFTAIGTGGIWLSDDLGETFRPISDTLPTQVVGDVSYTAPTNQFPDGVVHVVTGEHTFGGAAYLGLGVFRSTDLGATWQRSRGPNSGTLGFAIEVDPTNPTTVYAATGNGLWRSTDAGATYADVVLPTGDCAGDYNNETCNFANFVTDVVVQAPGGEPAVDGGRVVAAIGWRAGMATNPDGSVQSTHNGIYRSEDGAPGSFERLDGLDSAVGGRERIARTELGTTTGPDQDHEILYAIVEDAVLFNGGSPILDGALLGDETGKMISGTVLSGIYASTDFGATWTLLADDNETANTCPVNRSVYCVPGLGVTPGVQSWYNMWIQPDPTRTDATTGASARVLFGLEEIWQDRNTVSSGSWPLTGFDENPLSFEVIGSYYGELGCLVGQCVLGSAPTGPLITTTHPDQHAGIIIPLEGGGAKLVVGHDGGISTQTVDAQPGADTEFTQLTWELEQENGLQTLLPYSAVWANDGVAWAGLQDNGHMRVAPEELGGEPTADGKLNQFETFGADGTFAAVDPANSDYAVESTQNAGMNVTTDGGETWAAMNMPASNIRFVNPFVMDPLDSNHIVSGGKEIFETLVGPETAGGDWIQVFDLGTADSEPRVETTREKPAFQQSAIDTLGDTTYVGFCGVCDILNSPYPFRNGIATNVNGAEAPEKGTSKGWHKTAAEGLPNRFITSVAIDPQDASQRTVYVTLGGYSRSWVPPGTAGDTAEDVGEGHVFKSTDAGETFVDISGDLPDTPALWVEPRGRQLLVGTDVGPFISSDTSVGADWAVLGAGELPAVPITSIQLKPDDPDQALIGTYGRGLWKYEFPDDPFDGVDTPGQVPGLDLDRVAGGDRIATAIEVSKDTRERADTIAIARADLYADALAGSTIAFREDAPLLLSRTTDLPSEVADEIERLGATNAIVLGGDTALNPAVIDGLRAAGITEIDRYAGADRFQTAGLIAAEVGGENVWVTEGTDPDPTRGWPDAMSIAPVAAIQQRPILLVDTDSIPAATSEALDDLGITGARIVGGPVAVSEQVEDELADQVKVGERVAGGTRYATSVAAAKVGIASGLRDTSIWLARGGNFPDALAAGPSVAADGGVLLLVDETDLDESPETRDFLEERVCNVRTLRVLGGEQAIEADVLAAVGGIFVDRECGADSPAAGGGDVPTPPMPNPQPSGGAPPAAPGSVAFGPFDFEADAQGWTASLGDPFSAFTRTGPGHESDNAFRIDMYRDEAEATLTSPTVDGAGGDARIDFRATYNIEGGGFDELQVGIVPDGGDFQALATLGGVSNGYPDFSTASVDFTEPNGPYQIEFLFYSDEICSGLVTDGGAVLCGGAYESLGVDDVTLLR